MRLKSGFTLIEVVVVIGITFLLYGILAPVVMSARMRAKETACGENLRQTFLALKLYHDDYDEFPHFRPTEQLVPAYVKTPEIFVCPLEFRKLGEDDPSSPGLKNKVLSSYIWPCIPHRSREELYARRGESMPAVACPVHATISIGKPFYHLVRLNGALNRVVVRKEEGRVQEY